MSIVFMNFRTLLRHYHSIPWVMEYFDLAVRYNEIVCFLLYVAGKSINQNQSFKGNRFRLAGLVGFVFSLRKGFYKYQFGQFAWCHLTLLVVVFTSHLTIANMFKGLIWYLSFLCVCVYGVNVSEFVC